MPRGRKKKFKLKLNIRPETTRSIIALVIFSVAVLSLVSFFAPSYSLNAKVQDLLRGTLGNVAIFAPFLFLLLGILFVNNTKIKFREPRLLVGGAMLTLALAGFLHLFVGQDQSYEVAKDGGGGGLVGYKISMVLWNSISKPGAFVLLLLVIGMSLIILLDIPLNQILASVQGILKNIAEKFPKKKVRSKDDIDISSGIISSDTSYDAPEVSTYTYKSDIEPEIEIVPPPAEPMQMDQPRHQTTSLAPQTPEFSFADKIWQTPSLELLVDPPVEKPDTSDIEIRSKIIKDTLRSFGIDVDIEDVKVGSSVTQFSLRPKSVTKVSKIASLQENLALALASSTGSVRIEAPIPGKSLIGIEVPNNSRTILYFKSLLTSDAMKNSKSKISIVLGKDVGGRTYVYDIAKMPHLLIAGTTGSGKSVFIHNLMFSILYRASPQEVKFILMDPKRVELVHYKDIPHLITPVITNMEKAPSAFKWACAEMERRYALFEQAKARNIESYNEKSGFQALPYILIIVDELAEIMVQDPAGVEKSIIRLAQLARATGIHLILAVQRPSTEIITGVIIDQPGAEKLLGKGDMLFVPPDAQKPTRLQSPWITDSEISNLVTYLKSQDVGPEYKDEVLNMETEKSGGNVKSAWGGDVDDDVFDDAVELVVAMGKASASLLQRKLSIGYARAARLIDIMEEKGIIGPHEGGSKARDVLVGNNSMPGHTDSEPGLGNESVDSLE